MRQPSALTAFMIASAFGLRSTQPHRRAANRWRASRKAIRLPSVVAGLISRPVIAVPTSVGYGASFGGVAALLAMIRVAPSAVC
jgi:hypothetical protein